MRASLIPAVLLLGACAASAPAEHSPSRPWPLSIDSGLSLSADYLLVAGTGNPDPAATGETQRRSTSRDAALADARERLRAYLQTLPTANKDASALDRLARSAEPVSTRWAEDGTATATLRLGTARINQVLGTEYR